MKKLYIIAWTLFSLGLFMRFFHLPGAGPLSVIGTLLLFIHSIIYLFKNAKTDLPYSFLILTIALWTIYIQFRIMYWVFAQEIFIIAFLVSLTCFILHVVKQTKFKLPQLVLTIYIVFSLFISFVRSHSIFYFISLNTILNNESRNYDYYGWDKYSWFLYVVDKKEEAIEANLNAEKAVDETLKITQDADATEYLHVIKQHGQQIRDGDWKSYP